jgi:hypothetical protein
MQEVADKEKRRREKWTHETKRNECCCVLVSHHVAVFERLVYLTAFLVFFRWLFVSRNVSRTCFGLLNPSITSIGLVEAEGVKKKKKKKKKKKTPHKLL